MNPPVSGVDTREAGASPLPGTLLLKGSQLGLKKSFPREQFLPLNLDLDIVWHIGDCPGYQTNSGKNNMLEQMKLDNYPIWPFE